MNLYKSWIEFWWLWGYFYKHGIDLALVRDYFYITLGLLWVCEGDLWWPWCQLGVTWGHFGIILGHIGVTLAPLRGELGLHWGYFGGHWGYFCVTLGWLGHTSGSFWADEGDLGAPWLVLNALWAHFGSILGWLGNSFNDMAVPLGHLGMILEPLWDHLGCTFGMRGWPLAYYNAGLGAWKWIFKKYTFPQWLFMILHTQLDNFLWVWVHFYQHGIDLGIVWDYFYITLWLFWVCEGDLWSLWRRFGVTWGHFGVTLGT